MTDRDKSLSLWEKVNPDPVPGLVPDLGSIS